MSQRKLSPLPRDADGPGRRVGPLLPARLRVYPAVPLKDLKPDLFSPPFLPPPPRTCHLISDMWFR